MKSALPRVLVILAMSLPMFAQQPTGTFSLQPYGYCTRVYTNGLEHLTCSASMYDLSGAYTGGVTIYWAGDAAGNVVSGGVETGSGLTQQDGVAAPGGTYVPPNLHFAFKPVIGADGLPGLSGSVRAVIGVIWNKKTGTHNFVKGGKVTFR